MWNSTTNQRVTLFFIRVLKVTQNTVDRNESAAIQCHLAAFILYYNTIHKMLILLDTNKRMNSNITINVFQPILVYWVCQGSIIRLNETLYDFFIATLNANKYVSERFFFISYCPPKILFIEPGLSYYVLKTRGYQSDLLHKNCGGSVKREDQQLTAA